MRPMVPERGMEFNRANSDRKISKIRIARR